ncbi:MAG: ArsB/NhaD family transporter [Rhodospirillales bacterium]|jgi:Na+/H+ antiporter NhaD/arsenite permease-like protein|nr:ArsB/NhaD family transporter [Rhodospirillales bacterium]
MHAAATTGSAFGLPAIWVASALLVATYAAVISEKINRAVIALFGAALMVALGILTQEKAVEGVDFNTIGLLIGMMIIVAVSRRTGMFEYLAIRAAKLVKANPAAIMIMLQVVTAVVSALLDNVTTVLLVVPVTLVICERLGVKPYPYLVALIFASNIGGTATLIGDPPNILIGSRVNLSFNEFIINLAPVVIVIQGIACVLFHFIWGRRLTATLRARAKVMAFDERSAIVDRVLLVKSLGVLAVVMLGFVSARQLHLEPATIALLGAAALLLLSCLGRSADEQTKTVAKTFEEVEWITIFFFIGLFIVIYGVESTGLLAILAEKLLAVTGGDLRVTALAILWASAILSSIVDNIPFVATMIPLVKEMAPTFGGPEGLMPLWWALSLGACLGGNGTIIGASANLTVAGLAERAGVRFSFVEYMKVAYPVMLVTIVLAMVYIELRYL